MALGDVNDSKNELMIEGMRSSGALSGQYLNPVMSLTGSIKKSEKMLKQA